MTLDKFRYKMLTLYPADHKLLYIKPDKDNWFFIIATVKLHYINPKITGCSL